MSHGNHVAWPDKDVRLPELDMLRLAGQMRRAQDYEETILILLQFRPLVSGERILDSQVVQAKFFLNLAQQLLVRLGPIPPRQIGPHA